MTLVSLALGLFFSWKRREIPRVLHTLWIPLNLFALPRSILRIRYPISTHGEPLASPNHCCSLLVSPAGAGTRQAERSTQTVIKLHFMALPPVTHSLHSFLMRSPGSPGGLEGG